MSSQANVYEGIWTDWSSSSTSYNTLTLKTIWGGFLVAFLAMYVRLAGSAFWNIVRFVAHQVGARRRDYDEEAPFLQQQAILRNTGTPIGASWKLVQSALTWRKLTPASSKRAWKLIVMASVHGLVFVAAGLFSSRVTKPGRQDVLISNGNCGVWGFPSSTVAGNEGWQTKALNDGNTAAAYARNCYKDGNSLLGCGLYVKDNLTWTINTNDTCPFAAGMCIGGNTAAYSMDTGALDSLEHFGLNTKESLKYRLKRTCAPLHTKGFELLEVLETPDAGDLKVDNIYFGTNVGGVVNFTNQYVVESVRVGIGYGVLADMANPRQFNSWVPIPELNRTDADVSVIFINQNSIKYNGPVDDVVFSAHTSRAISLGSAEIPYYVGDYFTNVIGCIDQVQICKTSTQCSPLTDYNSVIESLDYLSLTDTQVAVAQRFTNNMIFQNAYHSVNGRGGAALRANELVSVLQSPALPNYQWQIEVDGWFGVSLARMQQMIVEYAAGPSNMPLGGFIHAPLMGSDHDLCAAQKIKGSNTHQNFNFIAVLVVVGICSVIVLLGFFVDTCVGWCQGRRSYAKQAWKLDNFLQLHRMAQEGAGYGRWENSQEAVPRMREDESLLLGPYVVDENGHATIESRATNLQAHVKESENMLD
ncbi:hypothetical protein KCU67_g2540, partial [Aureobasidium melanogenum]